MMHDLPAAGFDPVSPIRKARALSLGKLAVRQRCEYNNGKTEVVLQVSGLRHQRTADGDADRDGDLHVALGDLATPLSRANRWAGTAHFPPLTAFSSKP